LDIGGHLIVPLRVKNTTSSFTNRFVHTKAARATLSEEALNKLYTSFLKPLGLGTYKPLPIEINDPSQLTQFQQFDELILQTKERMKDFDVDDVFNVVFPDSNGNLRRDFSGKIKFVNLFVDYAKIEVKDVVLSNEWYHECSDNTISQSHISLQWSYSFFNINIDPDLMTRLRGQHDYFKPSQQGGPLLFILLLRDILSLSESAADDLHDQVSQLRIDRVPGENVKMISTVVNSVSRRIWFSLSNKFPRDYIVTVMDIYQTSSFPSFNTQFQHLWNEREAEVIAANVSAQQGELAPPSKWSNTLKTVLLLTKTADQYYDRYSRAGKWIKELRSKPTSSSRALTATGTATVTCFNCGQPHHISKSPVPRNETAIARNKENYMKQKKCFCPV
jgi:hypothetical protein